MKREIKDLEYFRQNAEEDYVKTPISVLRYIGELENNLFKATKWKVTKWIDVKDRLPNEHEKVLVLFGDEIILMGIIDEYNEWAIYWSDGRKAEDFERPIQYWMPLPSLPKQ